jgi:3-methyladenine DNA glycosylase AlkD
LEKFILNFRDALELVSNKEDKFWMEKYMRNQFKFFGLKSEPRRLIYQDFKKSIPKNIDFMDFADILFNLEEREWKYIAMDFLISQKKNFDHRIPELMEKWGNTDPWWDTVDHIAPKILGPYFLKFPENRNYWVKRWMKSPNFWHQRYCIIFQLMYKKEMDTDLLSTIILQQNSSKEFFIQKAIGWVLRQYARTNPDWVIDFCENNTLAPLSRREALRRLK